MRNIKAREEQPFLFWGVMEDQTKKFFNLVKKYSLTERDYERQISGSDVVTISQSCCEDWRELPSKIELDDIVAKDIDRKQISEEEKRHCFFWKWIEIKGSAATYKLLIEGLLKINRVGDAEEVCKLLKLQKAVNGHRPQEKLVLPPAKSIGR